MIVTCVTLTNKCSHACVCVCLCVHGCTLAWQCVESRVCGMCVCVCACMCVDDDVEATRSLGSTAVLGDSGIGIIFHGRSIGNFSFNML